MSPTQAARMGRGVSYFFMVLATIAIVIGYIRLDNNQDAIRELTIQRTQDTCAVLNQVKDAVLAVVQPIPEAGVTDPGTLARIRVGNVQRAKARQILSEKLACPHG